MMTSVPTHNQLSNLVPLNEATEEMRVAMLPYANLHKLSAAQELIIDRSEQSAYLLSGSVTPTGEDARALAPVAEHWQAFEPNHALQRREAVHRWGRWCRSCHTRPKTGQDLLAWAQLAERRDETSLCHPTGSTLFCVRSYSRDYPARTFRPCFHGSTNAMSPLGKRWCVRASPGKNIS